MNTYTANLAAALTISSIKSDIKGISDLRGKAVVTIPAFRHRLASYGIQATVLGALHRNPLCLSQLAILGISLHMLQRLTSAPCSHGLHFSCCFCVAHQPFSAWLPLQHPKHLAVSNSMWFGCAKINDFCVRWSDAVTHLHDARQARPFSFAWEPNLLKSYVYSIVLKQLVRAINTQTCNTYY